MLTFFINFGQLSNLTKIIYYDFFYKLNCIVADINFGNTELLN